MSAKKATQATTANGSEREAGHGSNTPQDAIELLKGIHKEIAGMVKGLKSFEPSEEKLGALRKAAMAWLQHAELEDRIAYPAFRDAGVDDTLLAEAMVKADLAMTLLADLAVRRPTDDLFTGGVRVFLQMIPQMIALEERKSSGLFAQAQKAGVDMKALGEALQSEMPGAEYEAEEQYRHPPPRHLRGAGPTRTSKENSMRGNYRERDERGRFTDDDDRRRGAEIMSAGVPGDAAVTTMATTTGAGGTAIRADTRKLHAVAGTNAGAAAAMTMTIGAIPATATMATMIGVDAGRAAGSAIRRAIRKLRAAAGITPATATADGTAIAEAIRKRHGAAGTTPTTAKADGTAIRKVIPRPPGAVGETAARSTRVPGTACAGYSPLRNARQV